MTMDVRGPGPETSLAEHGRKRSREDESTAISIPTPVQEEYMIRAAGSRVLSRRGSWHRGGK